MPMLAIVTIFFIGSSSSSTEKPVLRDHCRNRSPVLKDHAFLAECRTFQHKLTCHHCKDYLS